jgi:hypothetical protein
MPSCSRNSMIVVFKTWRSPSGVGPISTLRGQQADPISAVERHRYLVYFITIIKYNLKARAVSRTFTGIANLDR